MTEIQQVTLDMGGFEVNSYIIHAPEADIVVDAGTDAARILAATDRPVAAILVTHNHADHIGALEDVRRETGAPVYMHPLDAESAGVRDYEPLGDGEDMVVAGQAIHVLHTPGHSPGSVTFVVGGDQIVGDLILPGSVGRTDLGGARWQDLEISIRKVMPLWNEETRLFAGHGPVMDAMEEMRNNPYLPPVLA